jgi:hypothetical protein
MLVACEKRPVPTERLEAITAEIETQLHEMFDKEVASKYIGHLVMEALREVDQVAYVLSLLHLAVNGSVIAFLLYYGLARRRGYSTASYIAALAPLVAMTVSALFEGKSWGLMALGGVALVLVGQFLLLRAKRA